MSAQSHAVDIQTQRITQQATTSVSVRTTSLSFCEVVRRQLAAFVARETTNLSGTSRDKLQLVLEELQNHQLHVSAAYEAELLEKARTRARLQHLLLQRGVSAAEFTSIIRESASTSVKVESASEERLQQLFTHLGISTQTSVTSLSIEEIVVLIQTSPTIVNFITTQVVQAGGQRESFDPFSRSSAVEQVKLNPDEAERNTFGPTGNVQTSDNQLELESLRESVTFLQNELRKKEGEIHRLLEAASQPHSELLFIRTQLEEKSRFVEDLKTESDRSNQHIVQLEAQLNQITLEKSELVGRIERANSELQVRLQEIQNLKSAARSRELSPKPQEGVENSDESSLFSKLGKAQQELLLKQSELSEAAREIARLKEDSLRQHQEQLNLRQALKSKTVELETGRRSIPEDQSASTGPGGIKELAPRMIDSEYPGEHSQARTELSEAVKVKQQQIEGLETETRNLKELILRLQDEITAKDTKLQQQEERLSITQSQLSVAQGTSNDASNQMSRLNQDLANLKAVFAQYRTQSESTQAELNQKLSAAESEVQKARIGNQTLTAQIQDLQTRIGLMLGQASSSSDAQIHIDSLNVRIRQLEAAAFEAEQKKSDLLSQMESIQTEKTRAQQAAKDTQSQLAAVSKELSETQTMLQGQSKGTQAQETMLLKLNELRGSLQAAEEEIRKLKSNNENSISTVARTEIDLKAARSENKDLKQTLETTVQELQTSSKRVKTLESQIAKLETDLSTSAQALDKQKQEVSGHVKTVESLKVEITTLKSQISQLTQDKGQLVKQLEAKAGSQSAEQTVLVTMLQGQVDELTKKTSKLELESKTRLEELNKASNEVFTLKRENQRLIGVSQSAELEITKLKQSVSDYDSVRASATELRKQIEKQEQAAKTRAKEGKEEPSDLRIQIAKLTDELKETTQKLSVSQDSEKRLNLLLSNAKKELEVEEKRIQIAEERISNDRSRIEKDRSDLQKFLEDKKVILDENTLLKKTVESLKTEVKKHELEVADVRKALASLTVAASTAKSSQIQTNPATVVTQTSTTASLAKSELKQAPTGSAQPETKAKAAETSPSKPATQNEPAQKGQQSKQENAAKGSATKQEPAKTVAPAAKEQPRKDSYANSWLDNSEDDEDKELREFYSNYKLPGQDQRPAATVTTSVVGDANSKSGVGAIGGKVTHTTTAVSTIKASGVKESTEGFIGQGDSVQSPADHKKKTEDKKGGSKGPRDSQKDSKESKEPRKNGRRDQDEENEWVPKASGSEAKASEKKNDQSQSRKNKDSRKNQEDDLYVAKSQTTSEYVAKAVPSKVVTSTIIEDSVQTSQGYVQKTKVESTKPAKDSKQSEQQTSAVSSSKKHQPSQVTTSQKPSALLDPSLVEEYESGTKQITKVTTGSTYQQVKVEVKTTAQQSQVSGSSGTAKQTSSALLDPSVMEEYLQNQEDELEEYVNMEGIMNNIGSLVIAGIIDEHDQETGAGHQDKKKKKKKKAAGEKDPLLAQGAQLLKSMHKK